MPFDALTNPDNFRIQGSMTVINDPLGNAGNVNLAGTLVTSGTASFASALTASSISAGGLNSSFSAGLTVSGGAKIDYISGFTTPSASSQSASSANTPITMTSGFTSGGPNYIYVQASGTATATILLTPTASSATSGFFQDGVEVTIVNNSASATNIAIPSGNFGSLTGTPASLAIAAGHGVRFKYLAALQTWVPLV